MANSKRKCVNCKKYFPFDLEGSRLGPVGFLHSLDCQLEMAKKHRDKLISTGRKVRAKSKIIALKDKPLTHHWKITKEVMQEYARKRDIYYGHACISCGKHHLKTYATNGSKPTGGHYKTGGAHKNLQFNLWNINMEHLYCNSFDPDHLVGMRSNLIDRIGLDRVLWLESNPPYNKDWSDKDYLKRMRKLFKKRMKRYE